MAEIMELEKFIRAVPDFPRKGIIFRDITTLIKDGPAFHKAIDLIACRYADKKIDLVVCPEARGFIIGAALAYKLGVGVVPVRKVGKLPAKTRRKEYALEYGTDAVEVHVDAIKPGDRVVVVDDLLATGGTISATVQLVEELGGEVVGVDFLIELTPLGGREKLKGYDVFSIIQYPE